MSLIIRLTPFGKRGERRFRIVVSEKRSKRDGKPLEQLGWYEKNESGEQKNLKTERIQYWISQGAKPSPTIAKLIST